MVLNVCPPTALSSKGATRIATTRTCWMIDVHAATFQLIDGFLQNLTAVLDSVLTHTFFDNKCAESRGGGGGTFGLFKDEDRLGRHNFESGRNLMILSYLCKFVVAGGRRWSGGGGFLNLPHGSRDDV